MKNFIDILESCGKENCKCGKDGCNDPNCKCKKKCPGKYTDRLKEGKNKDDDEYGDWKYHSKKDDGDLHTKGNTSPKGAVKRCGTCGTSFYDKSTTKCTNCKSTKPLTDLKESKFESYLLEKKQLDEGIAIPADVKIEVQRALSAYSTVIPFGSNVDPTHIKNVVIPKLKALGNSNEIGKLIQTLMDLISGGSESAKGSTIINNFKKF